jgi:hypothetical protein
MEKYLNRAAEVLDVNSEELTHFNFTDSFNSENQINCFLCKRSDHRYGALFIYKINEEETEQIVYGTPKINYPFDKTNKFHWPNDINDLEAYEKVDGTNILAYNYTYKNEKFFSFKTRLTPVISDSKFGPFLGLWKELLENNCWIKELTEKNSDFNFSFEMFGYRNIHLIDYDFPLKTLLLFAINNKNHKIYPPSNFSVDESNFPKRFYFSSTDLKNKKLTEFYNSMRDVATTINSEELKIEGYVFYSRNNDNLYKMYKCKAKQVELEHWKSEYIDENSIWTTCINAHESEEDPSLEYIIELLKEEFSETKINKSYNRIEKNLQTAKEHVKIICKINEVYYKAKEKGFDVKQNKNETFRFMSQFFNKKEMRFVGAIILKEFEGEN